MIVAETDTPLAVKVRRKPHISWNRIYRGWCRLSGIIAGYGETPERAYREWWRNTCKYG